MECHKPKRCLKETQPGNGVFLGKPFEYEEEWMSCYLCKRLLENKEKGEDDECDGESFSSEV